MNNLFKTTMKFMIYFGLFVFLFMMSCFNLSVKLSYASDNIGVPIYIVNGGNFLQIVSGNDRYEIDNVSLKNLISGDEVKINKIDKQFFIYDELQNNVGYELKVSLIDISSHEIISQISKFKYLENSFGVHDIGINSCDVIFRYDRKNLIFIDGIEIYGKRLEDDEKGKFDFHIKKSNKEINNLRNIFKFKDISLHPATTYDVRYVINLKDNVSLVFDKVIRSKDFDISNMSSMMINNNLIEVKWDTTSNDFKFIDNDSINIYIKGKNDINYSIIPDVKITDEEAKLSLVELKELSELYDIKLLYMFGGRTIEREIRQINDFFTLYTDVSVINLKDLLIQFSFINDVNFKFEDKLNIYIEEQNDKLSRKKVFSKDLMNFSKIDKYVFEYKDLKANTKYNIDYEIEYSDGRSLAIKSESFMTLPFSIKDIYVEPIVDSDNNVNVKFTWELIAPNFNFRNDDSFKIFIKEKESSEYPNEPQFYANRDLNKLRSCILTLGRDISKEYDFKFVYYIDGREYVSYSDLTNNSFVRYQLIKEGESDSASDNSQEDSTDSEGGEGSGSNTSTSDTVKISIKDKKVNEVIFQLEYSENFKFEEGDSIRLFKKLRNGTSKTFSTDPDKEYIHSNSGDNPVNLLSLNEVSIGYLVPDKEYDFKIEFKTKNELKDKDTIPESGSEDSDGSEEDNDTEEGSGGGDDSNSSGGEDNGESGSGNGSDETVEGSGDGETSEDVDSGDSSEEEEGTEETQNLVTRNIKTRESSTNGDGIKTLEKKFENQKTNQFTIDEFKTTAIRPNSASFEWKVSEEFINFDEKDKVEIYIKRKIINGYPAGSSFSKIGSEVSGVLKGEGIVTYMDMDYTAKLVYTISNVKFEKTLEFKTISANSSLNIGDVTEYYAIVDIHHPKDYIFSDGDSLEIYTKPKSEKNYPKEPNIITYHDGGNKLEDLTKFNILPILPDIEYDVLLTYKTKANDIADTTIDFRSKKLEIKNCRIDSRNGNTLRIKSDLVNDMEVIKYLETYVDVFYKLPEHKQYSDKIIASASSYDIFDFECKIPDYTEDYDLLISYNPHGYFNEVYFIDFELEYRGIKATVEEGEKEEEGVKKSTFDLKWAYGLDTKFSEGDKLNIYLKGTKKPEDSEDNIEETDKKKESNTTTSSEYVKIHTIETDIISVTSFNLDNFVSENMDYSVMIEPVSEKFTIGGGKTKFSVDKIVHTKPVEETIFEHPVEIEEFNGKGNQFAFSVPDLGDISLTKEMNISCDIEGISAQIDDNGNIGVMGLVPGKEYPSIEIKIIIETGKEITFNIQNITLEAENPRQAFLYNVYGRAFLRDPDEVGYDYWINRLNTHDIGARDFLINLLFAEKEFSELEYTTEKLIEILYSIVVDRDPDAEGLNFWINFYNNEALNNANGDVFNAKKYIVDRMINEEEFMKMVVGMGLKY